MLEVIPSNTKIPFMKYRWLMVFFSVTLTVLWLVSIFIHGFRFGVDFAGGIEMVLHFPDTSTINAQKLRQAFNEMGIADASVQSFGTQNDKAATDFIVHFPADFAKEDIATGKLQKALAPFAGNDPKILSSVRFTGLEKGYITLSKPMNDADVKKAVESVDFGLLKVSDVQKFGRDTSNEYQITFKNVGPLIQSSVAEKLKSVDQAQIRVEKIDFVGAKVGKDLKLSALLSILITALLIFVYIFIRFDIIYAPGVVVSMLHDVIIVSGLLLRRCTALLPVGSAACTRDSPAAVGFGQEKRCRARTRRTRSGRTAPYSAAFPVPGPEPFSVGSRRYRHRWTGPCPPASWTGAASTRQSCRNRRCPDRKASAASAAPVPSAAQPERTPPETMSRARRPSWRPRRALGVFTFRVFKTEKVGLRSVRALFLVDEIQAAAVKRLEPFLPADAAQIAVVAAQILFAARRDGRHVRCLLQWQGFRRVLRPTA